jgi:hypothetical protein
MKMITLAPAMAWLVIFGSKDVENRSWADINVYDLIRTGERFGIHAGKLMTALDYRCAESYVAVNDPRIQLPPPRDIVRGAIIGTARIRGIDTSTKGIARPWKIPGRYAWLLKDRTPLDQPIHCRGYQRFWEYDLAA